MSHPVLQLRLSADGNLIHIHQKTERIIESVIVSPHLIAPKDRPPLRLALVLDRSGSMSGEKLDYVKRAALTVLDMLDDRDMVALVGYDNQVRVYSPCVRLTNENKAMLKSAITEIQTGGMTNLSGGWLNGCRLIGEVLDSQSVNRCLLLTDGLANEGIVDVEELAYHAAEIFSRGVSTSTFGVGHDYNERLLEAIANRGGGRYYFIGNVRDIQSIFIQELEGLTNITARNIRMRVELPSSITLEVVGDWTNKLEGSVLTIEIPDMYAGKENMIFLKAIVQPAEVDTQVELTFTTTADGEDGSPLKSEGIIQFTVKGKDEVEAQKIDMKFMRRYKHVEAAIEAEKALIMEKSGLRQEGSLHLRTYLQSAAPYLAQEDIKEHYETSNEIEHGMDLMMQKMRHMRNYNARRSNSPQADQTDKDKKPGSN